MNNAQYKKRNAQLLLGHQQVCLVFEQLIAHLAVHRSRHPIESMIAHLDELEAQERATPVIPLPPASTEATPLRRDTMDDMQHKSTHTAETTAEGGADAAAPRQVRMTPSAHAPRRVVVFIGPPCSGRTTQCSMAASAWSSLVLTPHRLLEEAMHGSYRVTVSARDTSDTAAAADGPFVARIAAPFCAVEVTVPAALRQAVRRARREGTTVSTDVLTQLIANEVRGVESSGRVPFYFILDGYPRTVEQAMALECALGPVYGAVEVYCSKTVSMQRMRATMTGNVRLLKDAAAGGGGGGNGSNRKEHISYTSAAAAVTAASSSGAAGVAAANATIDAGDSARDSEEARIEARCRERWDYKQDDAIALREYWKARRVLQVVDGTASCVACGRAIHRLLGE